jgi:hypothetical protein
MLSGGWRQSWAQRLAEIILRRIGDVRRFLAVRSCPHGANETKALARDRADQPLVLAAVADRLSRGVDAAG